MTDKDLLELAAKAVGMTRWRNPETDSDYWGDAHERYICSVWNPLTDDGDALRLTAALSRLGRGFHLDCYSYTVKARFYPSGSSEQPPVEGWCWTKHAAKGAADIYSINEAIRLAIVRAAAEIGKGMT